MLFHDSSYFQLWFIYHNHHGQKAIKYYIPDFYKTTDMFKSWYKVDKKGSFFHEDKLLFWWKTTWKVSSDPGGRAWEIRVWRRWRPGSTWNRNGDVELFICLVWGDFMHCFSKNEADSFKGRLHFYSSTCTFTITLRILPWPIPGAWPSSGK